MNSRRKYLLSLLVIFAIHLMIGSLKLSDRYSPLNFSDDREIQIVKIKLLGIDNGAADNQVYMKYSEANSRLLSDLNPYSHSQVETKELSFFLNPKNRKDSKVDGSDADKVKKIEKKDKTSLETYTETIGGQKKVGSFKTQSTTPLLSNSNVNVQVKTPKGYEINKLNEFDLAFQSFAKRLTLTFQSSIFRNYNKLIFENPHLASYIPSYTQELSGHLTYDREGNLLKIKTLKLSSEEMLSDFFMHVLKDVHTIPNLPEMLIDEKDQFEVTVNLTIN